MTALGTLLTRPECDGLMKDLALIVPRANLGPDEIDRMLDLYFGLLREASVTRAMLANACKAFIMAPKKGKPRFFPDPGELAELCATESFDRRRALQAFQRALDILDGKDRPQDATDRRFVSRERIHELAEKMRARA